MRLYGGATNTIEREWNKRANNQLTEQRRKVIAFNFNGNHAEFFALILIAGRENQIWKKIPDQAYRSDWCRCFRFHTNPKKKRKSWDVVGINLLFRWYRSPYHECEPKWIEFKLCVSKMRREIITIEYFRLSVFVCLILLLLTFSAKVARNPCRIEWCVFFVISVERTYVRGAEKKAKKIHILKFTCRHKYQ